MGNPCHVSRSKQVCLLEEQKVKRSQWASGQGHWPSSARIPCGGEERAAFGPPVKPCALCAGRKCRCQTQDEWGLNENIYYGVFLRPGLPGDEAISSSPVGVYQLQNQLDPDMGREAGSCSQALLGAGPARVVVGSLEFSHSGVLKRVHVHRWSSRLGDERINAFSLARGTGFTGCWTWKHSHRHIKTVYTSVVRQGEPVSCCSSLCPKPLSRLSSPRLATRLNWTGWPPPSHLAFSVFYFNTMASKWSLLTFVS